MPYEFKEELQARIAKEKNALICVAGETGCQPKDSKILMANGEWKNIQDIKIGDKVLSPQIDGTNTFSTVTNTTSFFSEKNFDVIELNHQKKKLYSCSSNHIIPVNYRFMPKVNGEQQSKQRIWKIRNLTAENFHKLSNHQKDHKFSGISSFKIDSFEGKENCHIEPYTLGVYLGDGHFVKTKCSSILGITVGDFEIMSEVSNHYKIMSVRKKQGTYAKTYAFSLNGDLSKQLQQYGLFNKKSGDKFIPKDALLSDIDYRKKLLAGLIDTDGTLSKGKSFSITTKSEQLADDIIFLVYSLGGRARKNKITKGIKSLGFTGKYVSVSFFLKDIDIPIKVKRKQKDMTTSCYISSNRIAITTKELGPCQVYGITLDSKSQLYVTDNFMVTHNSGKSYMAISLAEQVDPNFNINQVVYSIEDFFALLHSGTLRKGSCIVLDESGVLVPTREWYSLSNRVLNYVLQTFRQDNLIVFFCVPDMSFIDSQTRKLFHYFLQPVGIHKEYQVCYAKILRVLPNPRTGEVFWIHPRFVEDDTLQVISQIHVKIPTTILRHEYEKKKYEFRMILGKKVMKELHFVKEKGERMKIPSVNEMVDFVVANRVKFSREHFGRPILNIYLMQEHFKLPERQLRRIKRLAEDKIGNIASPLPESQDLANSAH